MTRYCFWCMLYIYIYIYTYIHIYIHTYIRIHSKVKLHVQWQYSGYAAVQSVAEVAEAAGGRSSGGAPRQGGDLQRGAWHVPWQGKTCGC